MNDIVTKIEEKIKRQQKIPDLLKKKTKFTQISNICLHDNNLSLDARGLMCILISYPNDWKFYNKNISKIANVGVDKLNKLYKQLEIFGYLKRNKKRDSKGKFRGFEFEICDDARLKSLKVKIEPTMDLSISVKSTSTNTNILKNIYSEDDYRNKMDELNQKLLLKQLNKDIKIEKLENLAVSTINKIF